MKIIDIAAWDGSLDGGKSDGAAAAATEAAVREIVAAVRRDGGEAVKACAAKYDRASPETLEVPMAEARAALRDLIHSQPDLAEALSYAKGNIERFALAQKEQFKDFEIAMGDGLIAGQRVIPIGRAAVYAPGGRFPYPSSLLMGVVPAKAAGVAEVIVASPPTADGLPNRRIMAAAAVAGADRLFALGGAQGIAALALGTASVPRCDVVVGPGNKYVAAAKKLLYGEVGIDFIAGPTDVLIVADASADPVLIAIDLLAQAEHDPDARARALLPSRQAAEAVAEAVERLLGTEAYAPTAAIARASWEAGGLLLVYRDLAEAVAAADRVAPEHLELHLEDAARWAPRFANYGSLFIGAAAAEVLGDYSAGINHTLPTSGSARFTGGLSVRHFLKTLTTLRRDKVGASVVANEGGALKSAEAAARLARAEGLVAHEAAAKARLG